MFFSVITKNLIREILFLKDGTGLRMKNFNVIVFTKILMLGFTEKSNFLEGSSKQHVFLHVELPQSGLGKEGLGSLQI